MERKSDELQTISSVKKLPKFIVSQEGNAINLDKIIRFDSELEFDKDIFYLVLFAFYGFEKDEIGKFALEFVEDAPVIFKRLLKFIYSSDHFIYDEAFLNKELR